MPSVLQGGVRRRRVRLPLLSLLAACVACGAAVAAWFGVFGADGRRAIKVEVARAAPPALAEVKAARKRAPVALVSVRGPVARRGFTPPIHARAAVLVDGRTGTVLWANREHVRMPIASTTKIM